MTQTQNDGSPAYLTTDWAMSLADAMLRTRTHVDS